MTIRTFCSIVGTREFDYNGNPANNQEMTVFNGMSGETIPYLNDYFQDAGGYFRLHGSKASYSVDAGCFTSKLISKRGKPVLLYGLSQMQARGRDIQFTECFASPREDLLEEDAFYRNVLCRRLIGEDVIHRHQRPDDSEIFALDDIPRVEFNTLPEERQRLYRRAADLLCCGKKVYLLERDPDYRRDAYRPVLRELFELIPARHRCEIGVATGRCPADMGAEMDGIALIVTDSEPTETQRGRHRLACGQTEEEPDATSLTRWSKLSNAERDQYSELVAMPTVTMRDNYEQILSCMDYSWKQDTALCGFTSIIELIEKHSMRPALRIPSINAEFCSRLPELIAPGKTLTDMYFDMGLARDATRKQKEAYAQYLEEPLQYLGLGEEKYRGIERDFEAFCTGCDAAAAAVAELNAKIAAFTEEMASITLYQRGSAVPADGGVNA